jgi:uncharacterized membrane protein YphA (DoxX/SURF4 family)
MKSPKINSNPPERPAQAVSDWAAATSRSDQQDGSQEVAMRTRQTTPARGPSSSAAIGQANEQRGCCGKDLCRIAFGVIWLIDAAFKWQSGFAHQFRDMINSAGQGQPSWLHWFYSFTHNVFTPHPYAWAYATASLETLIGLALILGFARKTTYILTALTGLGIWAIAEGFGGPYSSSSTDIGAAVMYAVVALGLLALNYEAGPSRFSVDYLLEQRIPSWHKVAEVEGRRRKQAPSARPARPVTSGPLTAH